MNPEKKALLEKTYQHFFDVATNSISTKGVESILDEKLTGVGTTVDEIALSQEDFLNFLRSQKQAAKENGIEVETKLKRIRLDVSSDENAAVILEGGHFVLHIEGNQQILPFRVSTFLVFTDNIWKVIHYHGSSPVMSENDSFHLNEWEKRNAELEAEVKERTKELEIRNREAEIEAATQKVRTQAMGMRAPEDIMEVLNILRDEILKFELGNIATWIWTTDEDGLITQWDISDFIPENELVNFNFTFDPKKYDQIDRHTKKWTSDENYYAIKYDGENLKTLIKQVSDIDSDSGEIFQKTVDSENITEYWQASAQFSKGIIGIDLLQEPSNKVSPILIKMASAFGLAYQRFKDLEKAELQAYESKVEASLERVRGMATAMNHSDDLKQIAEEMFKELEILKINPLRYGLGMIDGEKKQAELWASTVNNVHHLDMLGNVSLTWHPMLSKAFDAWDAQHEELIYRLEGKELSDYYKQISRVNAHINDLESLTDPTTEVVQYCSFFPFKTGALYAFTQYEPDEEGRSILKRFANVFEQAYTRFQDLSNAENQAVLIKEERDRLEITLKELRATQGQLVQQEKLASLGQLTAGIAHEIKNPLNFVNNFSELSKELVDEAKDEVETLKALGKTPIPDDALEEISDLLNDIDSNLDTIFKHGTRADNIVKSMLEHSRGGTGVMEPTHLNTLLKEFVNLAFHGMRANSNAINVDLNFELNDDVENVPLIAEDFSRVVVNLCNNAFDAMRDKIDPEKTDYKPKLSIRTRKTKTGINLEIEDNGSGISPEMKDKILQPFFTTKKGTEGTGLGLSITNDIIKAHGGSISIESELDHGTLFRIELKQT